MAISFGNQSRKIPDGDRKCFHHTTAIFAKLASAALAKVSATIFAKVIAIFLESQINIGEFHWVRKTADFSMRKNQHCLRNAFRKKNGNPFREEDLQRFRDWLGDELCFFAANIVLSHPTCRSEHTRTPAVVTLHDKRPAARISISNRCALLS